MPSTIHQLMFLVCLSLGSIPSRVLAQVIPDNTLPNNSIVNPEGQIQRITGGTTAARNLFHSFGEFSIPSDRTLLFDNALTIDNIITRVTGGKTSHIDGMLSANGNANLFLINPNGIVFGQNAVLDIGGSFIGSTADGLLFEDGSIFSATQPEISPLLTINVPIGLQFGADPGVINNRSQATQILNDGTETVVGLQVQPGRTLALVGGEVRLEGGQLSSAAGTIDPSEVGATLVGSDILELNVQNAGGRIEVGAVGANNQVQITRSLANPQILNFSYEGVENFQDIQLSNLAIIDTSGNGGGGIQLQGRNVTVKEGSLIISNTLGENPGETIAVKATESLNILGNTLIDDQIDRRLAGAGIIIPRRTIISTNSVSQGQAGKITIEAPKVIVDLGAQIAAFSFGEGRGGDISVQATESLEIVGQAISKDFAPERFFPFGFEVPGFGEAAFRSASIGSSVSASSVGVGDAGNVVIDTGRLSIRDGAVISTNPLFSGDGGAITVNATESVEVSGTSQFYIPNNLNISRSLLWTATTGSGKAQDLTINTQRLIISDGGTIQAAAFDTGEPGNVFINASELVEITGSGFSPSDGALPSDLSASSFGTANAGSLTISTDELAVRDGGEIIVNSSLIGDAGNLSIKANSLFLDHGLITATSTSGEGGMVDLMVDNQILLRRNSNISTTAGIEGAGGNGGDIIIDSNFIIAPPLENSDITANAFEGDGGNIEITANGIFGLEFRATDTSFSDITASSEFGLAGTVAINNPDVDPTSGLVELSDQTTDPSDRITTGCAATSGSSFTITRSEGLPEDPTNMIRAQSLLSDLRDFSDAEADLPAVKVMRSHKQLPNSIVQVKGWIVNQKGEIELVAALPKENLLVHNDNCPEIKNFK